MSDTVIVATLGIVGGIFSTVILDAWKDYRASRKLRAKEIREKQEKEKQDKDNDLKTERKIQLAVEEKVTALGLTKFDEIVSTNESNQRVIADLINQKGGLTKALDTLQITFNRTEKDLNESRSQVTKLLQEMATKDTVISEKDAVLASVKHDRDIAVATTGKLEAQSHELELKLELSEKALAEERRKNLELQEELEFYKKLHPEIVYVKPRPAEAVVPVSDPPKEEEADL